MFHKVIHSSFRAVIKTIALGWVRVSRPCPALVPVLPGEANRQIQMHGNTLNLYLIYFYGGRIDGVLNPFAVCFSQRKLDIVRKITVKIQLIYLNTKRGHSSGGSHSNCGCQRLLRKVLVDSRPCQGSQPMPVPCHAHLRLSSPSPIQLRRSHTQRENCCLLSSSQEDFTNSISFWWWARLVLMVENDQQPSSGLRVHRWSEQTARV